MQALEHAFKNETVGLVTKVSAISSCTACGNSRVMQAFSPLELNPFVSRPWQFSFQSHEDMQLGPSVRTTCPCAPKRLLAAEQG